MDRAVNLPPTVNLVTMEMWEAEKALGKIYIHVKILSNLASTNERVSKNITHFNYVQQKMSKTYFLFLLFVVKD